MGEFCVYEHWRPDLGVCFYIGKGKPFRAHRLRRLDNQQHRRIVEKLNRSGLRVEIRIVFDGLTEQRAFEVEVDHIALLKASGHPLVNRTNGGEGAAGCVRSEEFKQKVREALTGRPKPWLRGRRHSAEHREKISRGLMGRPVSEETRAKISAAQKGRPRPELIGRKISDEGIARLRDRIFTPEHRRKISESKRGKKFTDAHRAAISKVRNRSKYQTAAP